MDGRSQTETEFLCSTYNHHTTNPPIPYPPTILKLSFFKMTTSKIQHLSKFEHLFNHSQFINILVFDFFYYMWYNTIALFIDIYIYIIILYKTKFLLDGTENKIFVLLQGVGCKPSYIYFIIFWIFINFL